MRGIDKDKVDNWLPGFYNHDHMNRIVQLTENGIEKVHEDGVGSDYSNDYDSDASNKYF